MSRAFIIIAVAGVVACSGPQGPADLDTAHDACASCRMVVSDRHLASQVVASGEEPRFFDDLGCLREYLATHGTPSGTVFVADHRTGAWTAPATAVFSRLPQPTTPMASGFIAHMDSASRDADAAAVNSQLVSLNDVFGAAANGVRP